MRPVSEQFLSAIRGSHKMYSRVRVLTEFQTGVNPTGVDIPIISGSVSMSSNSDIRSSVDVTTDGNDAFPQSTSELLTPYGNELFVERGVNLVNGTIEIVSMGYHRIDSVEQSIAPDGPIRLTAYDRMIAIKEAELVTPVVFYPGTSVSQIFNALILDVYPLAVIEFDDPAMSSTTLTSQQIVERKRYDFLYDLVTSFGKIMYWDHRGILVIKSAPSPTEVVWDVNAGANGVLISMSRTINREGVYNAVITLGESTGGTPPVRGEAYDLDPASPTFYNGSYGKVPMFYSSSLITSVDQAAMAARELLTHTIGLPQVANFDAVPNPALEPLDPISINHADGVDYHIIETLSIPLTAEESQQGTTRRVLRFVEGG